MHVTSPAVLALCCLFVKRGKKGERYVTAKRNDGASQGCIALQRYTIQYTYTYTIYTRGSGIGVRGGWLLSCPTDVSLRESTVRLPRVLPPPPRTRIFTFRNPIPRLHGAASVVAHDTHNFAIMIPRTGGLSRAVIDPKRGDGSDFYVSPSPSRQLLSARHVRIFYRHNEVFQMLS